MGRPREHTSGSFGCAAARGQRAPECHRRQANSEAGRDLQIYSHRGKQRAGGRLAVSASANVSEVAEGGEVEFTFGVKNDGPNPATGLELKVTPPAGLIIVRPGPVWRVATLPVGKSETLTVVCKADSGKAGE